MADSRPSGAPRASQTAPRVVACVMTLGATLIVSAPSLHAQTAPAPVVPRVSAPADTAPRATRPDTGRGPRAPRRRPPAAQRPGLLPPVAPGRAFLSSLLVPGLGQSRLQRPTAAAVFVGIEFGVITMLAKSSADLRSARAFRQDSVPANYPLDTLGNVIRNPPIQPAGINSDLVRARRLHREDWIAALVFNHLISGAEAFVSANLYDLPAQIVARPSAQGTVVALSIAW